MTKLEKFIEKAKLSHASKNYDYSESVFNNAKGEIKIICPIHGAFFQIAHNHINGNGCQACSNVKRYTTKEFVEKSKTIHSDKNYDYSLSIYTNQKTKITIICPIHGTFEQMPKEHLAGKICKQCSIDNRKTTVGEFIRKSIIIHKDINGNDKYDYSNVVYVNMYTKVDIICEKHGLFKQTPTKHLCGQGCPCCKNSKGEDKINSFLKENKILFETQKTFYDCINTKTGRLLKFDFYLPDYNLCVEFDGSQHYEPFRFSKNKEKNNLRLQEIQFRDNIKNEYMLSSSDKSLFRIPYNKIGYIDDILYGLLFKPKFS